MPSTLSTPRATARASAWNGSQPPAPSMKRWYFISDHVERTTDQLDYEHAQGRDLAVLHITLDFAIPIH